MIKVIEGTEANLEAWHSRAVPDWDLVQRDPDAVGSNDNPRPQAPGN